MTDAITVLMFLKDYSGHGRDRYFVLRNGEVSEVDVPQLMRFQEKIVCHDYWLISPAIHRVAHSLPSDVVDLVEFEFGISGEKVERRVRERSDVRNLLIRVCDEQVVGRYVDHFYRGEDPGLDVLNEVGVGLSTYWAHLQKRAQQLGELDRALSVEVPVFNVLTLAAVQGIRVNAEKLRSYKVEVDRRYYIALKRFAEVHGFPYEVPREDEIVAHLEKNGFDLAGVTLDYLLRFVPMQDGFADNLQELRRAESSRSTIGRMSVGAGRVFPIVDSQATVTSRIYYRDPSLQSLRRQYRDVFVPDKGFRFSYVDYDQFEVGVIAALSGDARIAKLYREGDMYVELAKVLFGDESMRGKAKGLFLSYAYGMKRSSLLDAAVALGASRGAAKEFFSSFERYEQWKLEVHAEYEGAGRIGTSVGNYLNRVNRGPLSPKERRSSVSQVVQGTASLVFKKAILRIAQIQGVSIRIPMHDALLVQHAPGFDVSQLVDVFATTMTDHFSGTIRGKASIEPFFTPD